MVFPLLLEFSVQDVPRLSSSAAGHSTGPAPSSASNGSPPKRRIATNAPRGYDAFVAQLDDTRRAASGPKRQILDKIYQYRELADSEANLEWLKHLTDATNAGEFPTFGDFAVVSGSIRHLDDDTRRAANAIESEREEAARARQAATSKNDCLLGRQSNLRVH